MNLDNNITIQTILNLVRTMNQEERKHLVTKINEIIFHYDSYSSLVDSNGFNETVVNRINSISDISERDIECQR